jgi:hypothetical protein
MGLYKEITVQESKQGSYHEAIVSQTMLNSLEPKASLHFQHLSREIGR